MDGRRTMDGPRTTDGPRTKYLEPRTTVFSSRLPPLAPNRLTAVTYIGAVQNAADTWYAGWTCNSGYASFGTTSRVCTAVPSN